MFNNFFSLTGQLERKNYPLTGKAQNST